MSTQGHQQPAQQVQQAGDVEYLNGQQTYAPAHGMAADASMKGLGPGATASGDQPSFAAAQAVLSTNDEAGLYYEDLVRDAEHETRMLLMDIFFPRYADFDAMARTCDRAAIAERTELEKNPDEFTQRLKLLRQMRPGIAKGKALLRGMSDIKPAELKRIRDAAMDDGQLGAVEDWVAGLFKDQAEVLAKRLYDLELEETKSKEDAARLYTRLLPSSLTQQDVQAAREEYLLTLSIPLSDGAVQVSAQTPYHISTRIGRKPSPAVSYTNSGLREGNDEDEANHAVGYAKGSAEQTQGVVQGLIDNNHKGILDKLDAMWTEGQKAGMTEQEFADQARSMLEGFLADNHLGVDCSGFSMNVTLQDPDIAAGWEQRHPGVNQHGLVTDESSVSLIKGRGNSGQQNSERIPVSAARTGDLVINSGSTHVGVVEVAPVEMTGKQLLETEGLDWHGNGDKGRLTAETKVWKVGIAHSVDSTNGSIPNDLPGPHLGTYYFRDDGRRLAWDEVIGAMSSFVEFRRPMIYPASDSGST